MSQRRCVEMAWIRRTFCIRHGEVMTLSHSTSSICVQCVPVRADVLSLTLIWLSLRWLQLYTAFSDYLVNSSAEYPEAAGRFNCKDLEIFLSIIIEKEAPKRGKQAFISFSAATKRWLKAERKGINIYTCELSLFGENSSVSYSEII